MFEHDGKPVQGKKQMASPEREAASAQF